jgi:thiamine-phosphate pyrophosphorylase
VSVPPLLVLTDRRASERAGRSLPRTVAEVAAAGAPAVVLREKDLDRDARRDLARQLLEVVEASGTRLLIASDVDLAVEVGAAGVHLAAADPVPAPSASAALGLVGRSCHGADEVRAARAEGVDLVTVSPVATSASKPGYGPPIGVDGVGALVSVADPLPVLALGGVTPTMVGPLLAAGAAGTAVMGAVMRAADPGGVVHDLLDALLDATLDATTETAR